MALAVLRARIAHQCLLPLTARAGYVIHGELGDENGGRMAAEGELGSYVAGSGLGEADSMDASAAGAAPPPDL